MSADSRPQTQRDRAFGHAGDPRVAASIVLVGIVAALIGSLFMAIGPRLKNNPVRVVGARGDAICANQTWPSIDQRCLVQAKTESVATANLAKTEDDAKLSPLTATGAAVKVQPAPQEAAITPSSNNSGANSDVSGPPARSDATVGMTSNDTQEFQQERLVDAPRRPRRHSFPFGFRF
jgi:hypothetical protein